MEVVQSLLLGLIQVYLNIRLAIISLTFRLFFVRWFIERLRSIGITVDGKSPQDVQVKSDKVYLHAAQDLSLGIGESFVEKYWDCERVDEAVSRVARANFFHAFAYLWDIRLINYIRYELFNNQTRSKSFHVIEKHYDLGNRLYEAFLDKNMIYSCAYWKDAATLEEAQENKMRLIAEKLKLQPGMRVLDIGCGWGGLAKYLAQNYDVHVVGVTISKEGASYGQNLCRGLNVDIRLQDYRDIKDERFDRVVMVECLEHVGFKNLKGLFQKIHECLPPEGLFVLHTIGMDEPHLPPLESFAEKYIFPNMMLPSSSHITQHIRGKFVLEDWQNMGSDFDRTFMAWNDNFVRNWPKIRDTFKEPDRFFRIFTFYLQAAAGLFRARKYQLWHVVLSKDGLMGGYEAVR